MWMDEFSKAFQKMIEHGWEGQLHEIGGIEALSQRQWGPDNMTNTSVSYCGRLLIIVTLIATVFVLRCCS